ncbi:MAG: hypothetical protein MN733_04495, partial [Nitrososphaera sp.]|nr:hypothetical protein [Nitrososphaera sp.]
SHNDLKLLYRLVNEKQIEHGNQVVSRLVQNDGETPEQFEQRRVRVKNAFITTVSITGANGHVVTGHGEAIFESPLVPERISSMLYDTSFSPNAQLQYRPSDRASVLLDFSRPPLINFAAQPSAPTPNNSNWLVSAETESWSTSLSTRLSDFFSERKTLVDWLHRSATYDLLLLVAGFPFSLWGAYRLGNLIIAGKSLSSVLNTAVYVYAFFVSANVFRALFSYSRWVFPKIELESPKSPALRHRALWYALVIGVLVSALLDAIKSLTG